MAFNSNSFVNNIVSLVVAVIVVCVIALPVITAQTADMDASSTKTILETLPIFMVIGLLMACVAMFIKNKGDKE